MTLNDDDDDDGGGGSGSGGGHHVHFIVTGFGPFRNSKENPSMLIANRLPEYLLERETTTTTTTTTTNIHPPLSTLTRTVVIETSAEAARETITNLREEVMTAVSNNDDEDDELSTRSTRITIFLHIGVNYKGTAFQLERFAYNNATFRIPDERGFQPRRKPIDPSCEFEAAMETRELDLEQLIVAVTSDVASSSNATTTNITPSISSDVSPDGNRKIIIVSDDPGRFVCNYTYYCSLSTFHDPRKYRSLFLHVPPVKQIPLEEQLETVALLMEALRLQVCNVSSKYTGRRETNET